MKSILMSIQPKWVKKIISGEKTIEVRKTAPKEVPFKVYIYCTNGFMLRDNLRCGVESIQEDVKSGKLKRFVLSAEKSNNVICSSYPFVNRKIVGEFICDKVDTILCASTDHRYFSKYGTCLTEEEIRNYCNGNDIFGLHITDLKIYDEPKELGEFRKPDTSCGFYNPDLERCDSGYNCERCVYNDLTITRPPQSWQYVEEVEE